MFLRDRVMDFNMRITEQWLEFPVDGIWFSDDWGSQEALLARPEQWREFYKPCYQQIFDQVRGAGRHVWMHSCGNVSDIIPDLIAMGLDVLNPVQPRAMDIDEIAELYGGRMCFFGGVDTQVTIPRGSPQDIDDEVRHLVSAFFGGLGSYIGGTSHTILPDAPLRNIAALFDAFERHAKVQRRRPA
jgi:uroporphyrinogen decarboxylase